MSVKTMLLALISDISKEVAELNRVMATAKNTRRDVISQTLKVDIAARKLSIEKVEELLGEITETTRKNPKKEVKTAEMGTQTEATYSSVIKKSYRNVTVSQGNPMTIGQDWDLLVIRKEKDKNMELGIQRIFKNKYEGITAMEKEQVAQLKTATWTMGKEEEEPITRHIYRIDEGDMKDLQKRLEEVTRRMAKSRRNRLAIAWEDDIRINEMKDSLETLGRLTQIKFAMHIRPTTQATKKPDMDFIFVKKAAGSSYAGILKEVRDEVANKGLGSTIRGVRETRAGDLMLTMERDENDERNKIRKALQSKLGQNNIWLKETKPETIVHIKDINALTTAEDVETALRKELGDPTKRIKVVRMTRGFAGTQNAIVNLSKEDEEILVRNQYVRIGLPSCRVKQNRTANTCYKCWIPGHSAKTCQGPDRSTMCKNCGKEGHNKKECTEESWCAVCERKGHPALTTRCPAYREAIRVNPTRQEERANVNTPRKRLNQPVGTPNSIEEKTASNNKEEQKLLGTKTSETKEKEISSNEKEDTKT